MFRLVAAALVLLAAGPTVALAARPGQAQGAAVTRAAAAPPPALNIVRHKLKRGATPNYQTLEANIVAAYDRARVQEFYWLTFQSTKDARDVLYFNPLRSADEMARLTGAWPGIAAAHPELSRMLQRLAKLIETQSSTLTTRRDDIEYARPDVDFASMRALVLTTFHVKPGREGRFVEAVRRASGSHAQWVLYEANEESTFVLVAPLKSRAEVRQAPPVPRAVRALKGVFRDMESGAYVLMPAMTRPPESFKRPAVLTATPAPRSRP